MTAEKKYAKVKFMWTLFERCHLIRLVSKPIGDDSKTTQICPQYLLELFIAFINAVCQNVKCNSSGSNILIKVLFESETDKCLILEALLQAILFNDPACDLAQGAIHVLLSLFQMDVSYMIFLTHHVA